VGLLLLIVMALTVDGIRCRRDHTGFSSVLNAILPMIALFFVVSLLFHSSDSNLYLWLSLVALVCSLVLFFACTHKRIVKIILGVINSLVVVLPILAVVWTSLWVFPMCPPDNIQLVQTKLSPNGIYRAEVSVNDLGGLCGNTRVEVARANRDINILVGVFRPIPHRVLTVGSSVTLHWETDELLYITHEARGSHTLHFERQGREWVRLDD